MEPNKRPTFLTVICILSFVGILIGFASLATNTLIGTDEDALIEQQLKMEELEEQLAEQDNPMGGLMNGMGDILGETAKHQKTMNRIGFGGLILCTIGVVLMFLLKKIGFIPYLIGELVPPISSIVLLKGFIFENLLMSMSFFFFLLIAVVFVIMYALNLKHMK